MQQPVTGGQSLDEGAGAFPFTGIEEGHGGAVQGGHGRLANVGELAGWFGVQLDMGAGKSARARFDA